MTNQQTAQGTSTVYLVPGHQSRPVPQKPGNPEKSTEFALCQKKITQYID